MDYRNRLLLVQHIFQPHRQVLLTATGSSLQYLESVETKSQMICDSIAANPQSCRCPQLVLHVIFAAKTCFKRYYNVLICPHECHFLASSQGQHLAALPPHLAE